MSPEPKLRRLRRAAASSRKDLPIISRPLNRHLATTEATFKFSLAAQAPVEPRLSWVVKTYKAEAAE